jgi:hypothetical protein
MPSPSDYPVFAIVEGTLQNIDLTQPNNLNVIWPLPRDPKIDFHVILEQLLAQNSLSFINVVTEPTFEPSQLHDGDGHWTGVIALTRGADSARRYGIGEHVGFFVSDGVNPDTGQPNLVDITPDILANIPSGTPVDMLAQMSEGIVNIDIFSINTQLSEQLYLWVKTALFAAEKPYFMSALGYLDVLRMDGRDEVSGIEASGGTHMLAVRSMSYRTRTLEFLAATLDLVSVIQATYSAQTVAPGPELATVQASPAPTNTTIGVNTTTGITQGLSIYVGSQLTSVVAINGEVLTIGPMEYSASVGDAVTGISFAQQSIPLPT